MSNEQINFKALSAGFREQMLHLRRLSKRARIFTVILYSCALLWFLFSMSNVFFHKMVGGLASPDFILPFIIVLMVVGIVSGFYNSSLADRESKATRSVVAALFPDATYYAAVNMNEKKLKESKLFELAASGSATGLKNTSCYGRIELKYDGQDIVVSDIGVTNRKTMEMSESPIGGIVMAYRMILRPLFGARLENSIHNFRGMFGYFTTTKKAPCNIILLPDLLEDKIDYLAQRIQELKTRNGAQFMHLEDPDFERYFEVYADDEVSARRLLTPAVMRRITHLREQIGRNMMLSFIGNTIYYAVSTPDGVLRPNPKAIDEKVLEQLYNDVYFCKALIDELK